MKETRAVSQKSRDIFRKPKFGKYTLVAALLLFLLSCSSGGKSSRDSATGTGGSDAANFDCGGECATQNLTKADVAQILQQGIGAASALGAAATFAVVDRAGNVLGMYVMPGSPSTVRLDGAKGAHGGIEGAVVPAVQAVISKAGTGAYLSSQGNAFSTRTASLIIQENFYPGENNAPGGPLFGVQFSSTVCSDVIVFNPDLAGGRPLSGKSIGHGLVGPRPMPLGLSGDPGGFPIYKNGDLVGGVGVEIDGLYTVDTQPRSTDQAIEETVALAAEQGFEAPSERVANNYTIAGKSLIYSNSGIEDLPPSPASLPALDPAAIPTVPFFFDGAIRDGVTFRTAQSGFNASARAGVATFELTGDGGGDRFPVHSGASLPGDAELKASEVDAILDSAILTASRARGAIRRPLDSSARVSIFVIDSTGVPLGFVGSQDAPVFGADVSLQKARTALLFSLPNAQNLLSSIPAAGAGKNIDYAAVTASFLHQALDGSFAFSVRAIGNMARPFYPDGINGTAPGPLSVAFPGLDDGTRSWSPFDDGLQLDFLASSLLITGGTVPTSCGDPRFGKIGANGLQIFAGGVPLYRGGQLIGAIGVSGDGIDQDDMVAFYGASRVGLDFAGHQGTGDPQLGFNAPAERRADQLGPNGDSRLRYVNCPEAPFIGSDEQNVCPGS